jgi:hypothetical protein
MTIDVLLLLLGCTTALMCGHTEVAPMMDLKPVVRIVAVEEGVDPDLLFAIVMMESGGDPNAVGDDGDAVGLTQIHGKETYDTWRWLCRLLGFEEWADDDDKRYDPIANLRFCARAIKHGYGPLWSSYRLLVGSGDWSG